MLQVVELHLHDVTVVSGVAEAAQFLPGHNNPGLIPTLPCAVERSRAIKGPPVRIMIDEGYGVGRTLLWVALYGQFSSFVLFNLTSAHAPQWTIQIAAACFTLVDVALPFTYDISRHAIAVSVVVFLFPVTRPVKFILLAHNAGPLAAVKSYRLFTLLASLPVIPARVLPAHVRSRVPAYEVTSRALLEIAAALVTVVLGCVLMRAFPPVTSSTVRTRFAHLMMFSGFLVFVLDGCAALATAMGAGPVARPFNSYLQSESVADWWRHRWDTVISLTLRMSVYEPLTKWLRTQSSADIATAVRIAPALATFIASALVHEYTFLAINRHYRGLGQVSKFFLVQPFLSAAEQPVLAAMDRVSASQRVKRGLQLGITLTLVLGSVWWLWCPTYDPPVSRANERTSDAVLNLAGLCPVTKHCVERRNHA